MKRILLMAAVLLSLTSQSQSVDEVIQKYADNMGGIDRFKAIKSVKMTGNITVQGMELPITVQVLNGKAVRTDVDVMGATVISSYKDGMGWKQNEFAGAPEPTDMNDKELSDTKSQTHLTNTLMDYKTNGANVELLGKETVNDKEAFKIKLTPKEGGNPTTYFIAAADYTLIKTVAKTEIMGSEVEMETYYSEPKLINGLKFYMARTQKADGQEFQNIVFNNIELDVTIDEKIFNKP